MVDYVWLDGFSDQLITEGAQTNHAGLTVYCQVQQYMINQYKS